MEKGEKKYSYMQVRPTNPSFGRSFARVSSTTKRSEEFAGKFGRNLAIENDYVEWLAKIASTKARFLISAVGG